jgi:Holliday junction resolvasome RuvABC endonuclease subunit
MLQLYHKIEHFIDRVKVTSRGYDVMGLYTAGRPRDVTKCGMARYVLQLTCLRKNIFMSKYQSQNFRHRP